MKRLPTALMAVAMTTLFATATFADSEWSPNLLQKPNAEAELDDEWGVWKGGFSRLSSYNSIFPHQGNFLFRLAGTVKLTQNVNVSDYASIIDNGNAEVKIGSWFRLGGGTPKCSFITQYYDEDAAYLTEDSETIGCDTAKWTEQQMFKTVPPGTRTITFEIRVIVPTECEGGSYWDIFTQKYCDVLLDDAYFHINSTSTITPDEEPADDDEATSNEEDKTSSEDDETSSDTPAGAAATNASLHFKAVKPLYQIGTLVVIDLVENLQVATRFHRVDLWVAIELPDGNLLFMTEDPFEPFSNNPQAFKSSLDTSQTTHQVLEFEVVPTLLSGNYTFYAVYVKEGQNPMNSFLGVRSNIAMTKIMLSNE
ncbi:MAG: hypothetical protein DRR16_17810 [Candidatus Parabeggiatoa sp. nov. 3]|nr:MAG: hypothetical protein DRR00_08025 [Gammaproteobacteria bacterium]RKZ83240.1 MAG: hypothetical protein DRR16_17810 [Gammaproteobacteria bacterium]